MKRFAKIFFIILFFIILINFNNEILAVQYKNTTKAYFLAEITEGQGNGDCILLENYDSKGEVHYGLIDAGREIKTTDDEGNNSTKVKEFLKKYMKKDELEFILITHSHGDHNGDALTVINNFNVKNLYMKEYDNIYSNSDGWQWQYEQIIEACVNKNVNIIGCDYNSIMSKDINPSTSTSFLKFLDENSEKAYLFNGFNEKNIEFNFGSANLKLYNWEIFNTEGDIWNIEQGIQNREKVTWENNNSLGLLLTQGKKKAFFSGDINNLDENTNKNILGDEDRIKDDIGNIDFLKLGHHGYVGSNTEDYLNVLKPEFAVITNDVANAYFDTIQWLENNNVEYLYTTNDEKGIVATITENDVSLNFLTTGELKKVNGKQYFIAKNENDEKDWKNLIYDIEYKEKIERINSAQKLKEVIDTNKKESVVIDNNNKKATITSLKLIIENDLNINENITINDFQNVTMISNKNIKILRNSSFKGNMFTVKGILNIGTNNMSGTITIDGNKENVASENSMIDVYNGELNIYAGVFLKNNNHTITNVDCNNSSTELYSGSAIYMEKQSIFNMYGGEISENIINNSLELTLENQTINSNYNLYSYGAAIYMQEYSELNMYNGKIINNEIYNNSKLTLNNVKYVNNKGFNESTKGVGIESYYSTINIQGGEISNNYAENNSIINILNSEIYSIDNSIYGIGIYTNNSILNICNVTLKENNGVNKADINIENSNIEYVLKNSVDGGAINTYYSKTNIDKINLLENKIKVDSKIYLKKSNIKSLITASHGAGIYCSDRTVEIIESNIEKNENYNNCEIKLEDSSNVEQTNNSARGGMVYGNNAKLIINNCLLSDGIAQNNVNITKNSDCYIAEDNNSYGGAINIYSSIIDIIGSKLNNNYASYGGAIYIADNSCISKIKDTEITNNTATAGSGGGVYAYGKIFINGQNTKINNNIAHTYGGGLILKNIAVIEDAVICGNRASTYAGGGIRVDGRLIITSGNISNNIANSTGGGIDFSNGTLIKTNVNIYNNLLNNQKVENIYPNMYKITKDEIPPEIKINYEQSEEKDKIELKIEVKDSLSEVKQVTLNGKELAVPYDGIIKVNIYKNGIYILKVRDYVGNVATKEFVISNLIEKNENSSTNSEEKDENIQANSTNTEEKNKETQDNIPNTQEKNKSVQDSSENSQKQNRTQQNNIINSKEDNDNIDSYDEDTTNDLKQLNTDIDEQSNIKESNTNEYDSSSSENEDNTSSNLGQVITNRDEELNDNNDDIIDGNDIIDKNTTIDTDPVENIQNEYGGIQDSDYIEDDDISKAIQEALANDLPKTGEISFTLLFVILGIVTVVSYIKYRKYKEII